MITYIIEKLYHFQCNECGKWWSVGDFNGQIISCPFCGHNSCMKNIGEAYREGYDTGLNDVD